MLKSSIQGNKAEATEYVSILSFFSGILARKCLLTTRLKHSKFNLVFDIRYNFISECSVQEVSIFGGCS